MAPITQIKRNQPQKHIKDTSVGVHSYSHSNSVHGHGNAAKENSNIAEKLSNKNGLEILDFHESWLEEMEIYKDKMYLHKQSHHHYQPTSQQQQQLHLLQQHQQQILLNAHNQAVKVGAYSDSLHNSHNKSHNTNESSNIRQNIVSAATNFSNSGDNSESAPAKASAAQSNNNTKRKGSEHTNINVQKQRAPASEPNKVSNANGQRPREEVTAKSASPTNAATTAAVNNNANSNNNGNNSKRHAHSNNAHSYSNSNSNHNNHSPSKNNNRDATPHLQQILTTSLPSNANIICNTASKPSKIIVNQFHASSLLSSQQQLEEKNKILTQNGLTKSAASAYETSLYASNYLPLEQRPAVSAANGVRYPHVDYNNYTGVSLAKHEERHGRDSHSHSHSHGNNDDDDPCAAIDDVNDYTDTDSEEEYTGYPFYLDGDINETHQSRNIHYKVERASDYAELETDPGSTQYHTPNCILSPSMFPNVPPFLNFASHSTKGPPMPLALHKVLKWKLSPVMPKIVKRVVLNSGFRIIKNTTDWMAIWEKHMKSPGFRTIRSHQKYNHMPGSFRIGRKDSMWRSIHNNIKRYGNKEFGFMQKSFIMPEDLDSLRQAWPKNASRLTKWIVKPPASARGTGIRIVNKWSQFPKDRPLVVQKYIERPLLINDNKFDMRIYVVLTSINPLRIYMYKDGLARFASVKYSSELNSLDDRCMHLTNYSINKFSQNYSKNEDFNACQGHKWTLQSLWSCLEARGVNTKHLWATLRNLVIKAIVSGESGLNRMYRQNVNSRYNCFELFGFDVLLDENIVPWLLEINISPSLHSELPLDLHVKGPLIQALLNTALYQVPPKLNDRQQKEILAELNMEGPLCHDKRIFTTCLTAEEVRKHNEFTNHAIEFREEYIETILENLLPDDVRCLITAEDELARSTPLERIFPTRDTHIYLKFIENPRYYNRLLDAWEQRYSHCREKGITLLRRYCHENYHLQVSEAALEKEPNVALTEIDMLHVKKSDDNITLPISTDSRADDGSHSAHASKAGSPDSIADSIDTVSIEPTTANSHSSSPKTKSNLKETSNTTLKPLRKTTRLSIHIGTDYSV